MASRPSVNSHRALANKPEPTDALETTYHNGLKLGKLTYLKYLYFSQAVWPIAAFIRISDTIGQKGTSPRRILTVVSKGPDLAVEVAYN